MSIAIPRLDATLRVPPTRREPRRTRSDERTRQVRQNLGDFCLKGPTGEGLEDIPIGTRLYGRYHLKSRGAVRRLQGPEPRLLRIGHRDLQQLHLIVDNMVCKIFT
jgi:hypothetical protein